LAALGSQIIFEGNSTKIEVGKRKESIIEMLKERFQEEQCEGDWRIPIREALTEEEDIVEMKILEDYALVRGELYHRMLGGVLSRCVGQEKAQRRLKGQDLQNLRGGQPLLQTSKGRLLLGKHG